MKIRDAAAKVGAGGASQPTGETSGSQQVSALAKVFDDAAKADAASEKKSSRRVSDNNMKIKSTSQKRVRVSKKPENRIAVLEAKIKDLTKKVKDSDEEHERLTTAYNDLQEQFNLATEENKTTIESLNKTINDLKSRYGSLSEISMEYDPETDTFTVLGQETTCPFDQVKTTFDTFLKFFPDKRIILSIKGQDGEKTLEEVSDSRKVQDSGEGEKKDLAAFASVLDKYLGGEATFEEVKEFPIIDLPQAAQEVAAQLTANDGYLPQEAADEILPAFKKVLSESSIEVPNLALITDSFDSSILLKRLKAARVSDSVISGIESQIPGTPQAFHFSRTEGKNSIKVRDDLYLCY